MTDIIGLSLGGQVCQRNEKGKPPKTSENLTNIIFCVPLPSRLASVLGGVVTDAIDSLPGGQVCGLLWHFPMKMKPPDWISQGRQGLLALQIFQQAVIWQLLPWVRAQLHVHRGCKLNETQLNEKHS